MRRRHRLAKQQQSGFVDQKPRRSGLEIPKGHIDEGEDWEAAAQREVKEETGYDTVITDFAGFRKYPVKKRLKVVLYWHMEPVGDQHFEPSDEIEGFEWLPVADAINRLTFLNDKQLLLSLINDGERN